jgi:hypothetical protein
MSAAAAAPGAPGSALWLEIAESRRNDWPTFTDGQYAHLLLVVAERFPGMDVLTCRPLHPETVLSIAWDAESLLSCKILEPADIPPGKKRVHYAGPMTVRRIRGCRLELTTRVIPESAPEHSTCLCVGSHHPLAMFLPDAIQAFKGQGRLRPPWLRLVVDNTRVQS